MIWCVFRFTDVDYNTFDINDIVDIHKSSTKNVVLSNLWINQKAFMGLLSSFDKSLVSVVDFTNKIKCVSLNNLPCINRLTLVDLNPN